MSLLGISFNCGNLFESFSCFCHRKPDLPTLKAQYENELLSLSDETIQILPFVKGSFELQNLFPTNNHVEAWSHLVLGCDKRVVSFKDALGFSDGKDLPNNRFDDVLKGPYARFFEVCMDMILSGCGSSFLLLFKGTVHLATLFSYLNESGKVVGGAVYIRKLNSIPEVTDNVQMYVQARRSKELRRSTDGRNNGPMPRTDEEPK